MCRLLEVSSSSYYAWLSSKPSKRSQEDSVLSKRVEAIFSSSRSNYGTRRIKEVLHSEGHIISRRRIGKLMKSQGLACKTKRKFKATTNSTHCLPIAPDRLKRNFSASRPDEKYVGDITYVWTGEGWMYLAVVIDLFSRRVVGWSMDKHMRAELVNNALLMALWRRKPKQGLLWHTDRGAQYASISHRDIIKQHKIKQSMSRKGDCWDNAVSEKFFWHTEN
jgi:putative transposase